ncbi:MAG: kynureninase [Ignavibacteriae bacterium]|nr:kynureninase [Ignavibacteriota bacterium]
MTSNQSSSGFAHEMDARDSLAPIRNEFYFPKINGNDALYFCGNSLGLQPKTVESALLQELEDWKNWGVEGHFNAKNPWFPYHKMLTASLARTVGAIGTEIVCMNTLTVNLHLLMISFYRPTRNRYKIIMEAGAFPSDQYAMESQVRFHGFEPDDAIVEIAPRKGEYTLRTEDILDAINNHKDSISLVMFSGVQYFTGQRFDMKQITSAAHEAGGWGNDEATRFEMKKGFRPARGAEGWQISNAQVFQMAALRSSLSIFDQVELSDMYSKRDKLTGYLKSLLDGIISDFPNLPIKIITPETPSERGCQLSLLVENQGRELYHYLVENSAIVDWREPNVIRIAPVPLYNSFEDVYKLTTIIRTYFSTQFLD